MKKITKLTSGSIVLLLLIIGLIMMVVPMSEEVLIFFGLLFGIIGLIYVAVLFLEE